MASKDLITIFESVAELELADDASVHAIMCYVSLFVESCEGSREVSDCV